MWTYIENDNINKYLKQYPKLEINWNAFQLLKNKNITFLPRYFKKNYPSEYLIEYNGKKEYKIENISINLKRNFKLKPIQQEAYDQICKLYNSQKYINGILKLPTGTGKTILAIYIICKLGLKAAIIVDNKKLLKQWINQILTFTDLTEEDIGLVHQKIVSCKNKKIIMCMCQSLYAKMKNNLSKIFHQIQEANIGLVFIDEVHSAEEQNSKIALLFQTPNIIGLSATPFHTGYQDILMKNTVGDIIFESTNYDIIPECYVQYFDSKLTKYKYIYHINDFIKQRAIYNKIIIKSNSYFLTIKKVVEKMKKENKKAQILIIAMTLKQVELIADKLKSETGYDVEILTGDHSEISDSYDIIVGTYKFCRQSLDITTLDCLLIATPLSGKKSYIQVTGRILRNVNKTKKKATVVSLFDSCFINIFLSDIKRIENILQSEYHLKLKVNYLLN